MLIKIIYYKAQFIEEPLHDSDDISKILFNFAKKIKLDLKDLSFFYKGQALNLNKKLLEYKTKIIVILAYNLKKIEHKKNTNDILCPGCNNPAIINISNSEISPEVNIMNCKNKHINFDIPFKEFLKMKDKNYKSEKCDICGNYDNLYGEPLDICSCGKIICPLCKIIHDPSHCSVNFIQRFKYCSKHSLPFIIYCQICNINICEKCKINHSKHKLYKFKDIPSIEKKKNKNLGIIIEVSKNIKNLCKLAKDEINRTQMIFNKVINYFLKDLEGYSILNDNLLEWVKDEKNYETTENIKNIFDFNKKYKKNLENNFIKVSFDQRIKYLLDFYNQKRKHLTIYYKNPKGNNNLRIFNKSFVTNNEGNCYLKIRNKTKKLNEYYKFKENYNESDLSEIKIKLIEEEKKKLNLYKMFQGCVDLLSFDEDEFFFTEDSEKIDNLFYGCENLKTLPDLSMMIVSNIKDFKNIFSKCCCLTSLPDISKWITKQAISFIGMFKECKKLINIPDISKWDTSKVENMSEMFSGCESLISLPDISVWNTSQLKTLDEMFSKCTSLISFPKLNLWNLPNLISKEKIFKDCNKNIIPILKEISNAKINSTLKTTKYYELLSILYANNLQDFNWFYNKFCEAFFIVSLNKKEKNQNKTIENKPEIIFKYPSDINEKFDLEDLAYSCFTDEISAYIRDINGSPPQLKSYIFSFKNEEQEKFYLINYFAYKKITLEKYYSEYRDNDKKEEKQNKTKFVYIPFCFCLISKYFYENQLFNCLQCIYSLFSRIRDENDYLIFRELILFIINSIPIPPFKKQIEFSIPFIDDDDLIKLDYPIYKGHHIQNTNFYWVLLKFSNSFKEPVECIKHYLYALRILLCEKSLIIIDSDNYRLSKFCDAFLSLLYPFQWIHTYIPILNEKNIRKIDLSKPCLIGCPSAKSNNIEKLLQTKKKDDEVFLLFIIEKKNIKINSNKIQIIIENIKTEFTLGSSFISNLKKEEQESKFKKYFTKYVPDFPEDKIYKNIFYFVAEKNKNPIKPYSKEYKSVNIDLQRIIMSYLKQYFEKKKKNFLEKIQLFNNYIKNKENKKLEYFREMTTNSEINNDKNNINSNQNFFEQKNEIYMIYPFFSSIEAKVKNIEDYKKILQEKFPEKIINDEIKIFENDIELKENDFLMDNDKIYLIK